VKGYGRVACEELDLFGERPFAFSVPTIRFSSCADFVEDDALVFFLVEPSQFVFVGNEETRLWSVAQRPDRFPGLRGSANDCNVGSSWAELCCEKLEVSNGSLPRIVIVRFRAGGMAYLPEAFRVGVWYSFAKCIEVPVPFSRSNFAFSNIVARRPASNAFSSCVFSRAAFVERRMVRILAAVIDALSPRFAGLIVPMSSIEVEEIELALDSSSEFHGGVEVITAVEVFLSGDDATLEVRGLFEEVDESLGVFIAAWISQ